MQQMQDCCYKQPLSFQRVHAMHQWLSTGAQHVLPAGKANTILAAVLHLLHIAEHKQAHKQAQCEAWRAILLDYCCQQLWQVPPGAISW